MAGTTKKGRWRFAGYPDARAYEPNPPAGKKPKKADHLPWGFTLWDTGEREGSYREKDVHGVVREGRYAVCARRIKGARKQERLWIPEHQIQDERCLEVVFVDIGQGDGCFLVTPENRRMVIDAGEGSNMRHYLNWRHGSKKKTTFEAAIISHPDSDHYKGFQTLFHRENFFFETLYTNGLMEYVVPEKKSGKKPGATNPRPSALGTRQKIDGTDYVTTLVTDKQELEDFLEDETNWVSAKSGKGKQFPTMLKEAVDGTKIRTKRPRGKPEQQIEVKGKTIGGYRMLSIDDGWMPGYGEDRELSIQVLGPVTERVGGRPMLRWLSSVGKTKNGHSVVLKLKYRNVSMMLGGDLNIPSEHLLLSTHTRMSSPPERDQEEAFLEAARRVFQVDVAKSCHHGSSDFTHWFLQALNPIATVISSGDDEPHSHPRSDTLGAVGRYSRSNPRPLIFSTELARSSKDSNQKPWELRSEILDQVQNILDAKTEKQREKRFAKLKENLETDIPRSVAVYGAIHVVTDGRRVIIYQKLERASGSGKYDIYRLEPSGEDGTGPLMYVSKH